MSSAGLTVESKVSWVRLRTSEASSARTPERPARRREEMTVNRMLADKSRRRGGRVWIFVWWQTQVVYKKSDPDHGDVRPRLTIYQPLLCHTEQPDIYSCIFFIYTE